MEELSLFKFEDNCVYRKSLLYRSGIGKNIWALNHVQGCAHGCRFPCYAFMMAKSFGRVKNYEEWIRPRIVCNALELLRKELRKYRPERVTMCLSTDPFMYDVRRRDLFPEIKQLTLEIIALLNAHGISVTTLTKGFYPDELTDKKFLRANKLGITLVSLNPEFKEKYEPFSAPYELRIESLRKMHGAGFRTWVNMEPYPTPNLDPEARKVERLLGKINFVDEISFGRWNYNPEVKKFRDHRKYYAEIAKRIVEFCDSHHIRCSDRLRKYAGISR